MLKRLEKSTLSGFNMDMVTLILGNATLWEGHLWLI